MGNVHYSLYKKSLHENYVGLPSVFLVVNNNNVIYSIKCSCTQCYNLFLQFDLFVGLLKYNQNMQQHNKTILQMTIPKVAVSS